MSTYYKIIMAGLFGLNILQMRQVRMLLKAGIEVRDQRDDLVLAVHEMIEIRDTLTRVLYENDVELSDFDRVLLESNVGRIKALLEGYEK